MNIFSTCIFKQFELVSIIYAIRVVVVFSKYVCIQLTQKVMVLFSSNKDCWKGTIPGRVLQLGPSRCGIRELHSEDKYTGSLESMDAAGYFRSGFPELVEIWHTVKSV
jgi:hypothetical protein